jgi:uncharacterized protein
MAATRASLPNARWHFQHGPIDLIIGACGVTDAVKLAHENAWQRFQTILDELVAELPALRLTVNKRRTANGVIAKRMVAACTPFSSQFITPMAAVAGAVADEMIDCYRIHGIDKAWVNNGGDIAFHLAPSAAGDSRMRLAVVSDSKSHRFALPNGLLAESSLVEIDAGSKVRGVATSGWRGRSFSLGIADAVTVLANTSAQADAAATMIANAVNVSSPLIERAPASALRDDTDLGDRLVTVNVRSLPTEQVTAALARGAVQARAFQQAGLIVAALLHCQGQTKHVEAVNSQSGLLSLASAHDSSKMENSATNQVLEEVA